MAKSANIALIAIDKTRGSGWMLITITGDVAAVASAITSGAQLAQRENGLVAQRVIPRPADDLIDALLADTSEKTLTPAQKVTTSLNTSASVTPTLHHALDNTAGTAASARKRDETETATEMPGPAHESVVAESATDIPTPVGKSAEPMSPSAFRAVGGETGETASMVTPPSVATDICNLCNDPACPRRKGEPRAACLHHDDRG